MKLKKSLPCAFAASLVALSASGQWTKVTDFQELSADTIARWFQIEDASAQIYVDFFDPFDASNKALYMDAGLRGVRCNALFVAIPLPQEVPIGDTVTFKFDFFMAGPSFDLNAGLSPTHFVVDENAVIIDPATPAFNNFEAQIRMNVPLDVRDGSNFRQTLTVPPIGEWMTIYIISKGASKTVEGYLRTQSGGLEKIEIPVDSRVNDFWNWRIGGNETLKAFYMGSSNACERGYDSNDIYLIDNVYIDYSGINLDGDDPINGEDPIGGDDWAGFELFSGWANTNQFLGWVYPSGDWVFVVGYNTWVYLPEMAVGGSGAWIYLPF